MEISLEELGERTAGIVSKNLDEYSSEIVSGSEFDSVSCGSQEPTISK